MNRKGRLYIFHTIAKTVKVAFEAARRHWRQQKVATVAWWYLCVGPDVARLSMGKPGCYRPWKPLSSAESLQGLGRSPMDDECACRTSLRQVAIGPVFLRLGYPDRPSFFRVNVTVNKCAWTDQQVTS